MEFPAHPFWTFSVTLYGRPGVAPACLELQERHGLDVNILLFCIWLAASGRGPVSRAGLEAAFRSVAPWHNEVVRVLRPLRRRLKPGFEPVDADLVRRLRALVQKVEIDAEHVEQLTLAASDAAKRPEREELGPDERSAHAARHIAHYFAQIGAKPEKGDEDALCVILSSAFALPREVLRAHLERAFA